MAAAPPNLDIIDDDPLIAGTLGFLLCKEFSVFVAESRSLPGSLHHLLEGCAHFAWTDPGLSPALRRANENFKRICELPGGSRHQLSDQAHCSLDQSAASPTESIHGHIISATPIGHRQLRQGMFGE